MRSLVIGKEDVLAVLNKHMKDTQSSKLYATRKHYEFFVDGEYHKVSIQASAGHYSTPREDGLSVYKEVELGYPNFNFSNKFIQHMLKVLKDHKTLFTHTSRQMNQQKSYMDYLLIRI